MNLNIKVVMTVSFIQNEEDECLMEGRKYKNQSVVDFIDRP